MSATNETFASLRANASKTVPQREPFVPENRNADLAVNARGGVERMMFGRFLRGFGEPCCSCVGDGVLCGELGMVPRALGAALAVTVSPFARKPFTGSPVLGC